MKDMVNKLTVRCATTDVADSPATAGQEGDLGGLDEFRFDEVSNTHGGKEGIWFLMSHWYPHIGGGARARSECSWPYGEPASVASSLGGRGCDERHRR